MRAINDVWASGTSGIKAESSTGASARDGEEGGVSLSARRADEPTGHEAEASSGRRSRDMYANVAYFLSEASPSLTKTNYTLVLCNSMLSVTIHI
jgi:hypothetical protein